MSSGREDRLGILVQRRTIRRGRPKDQWRRRDFERQPHSGNEMECGNAEVSGAGLARVLRLALARPSGLKAAADRASFAVTRAQFEDRGREPG